MSLEKKSFVCGHHKLVSGNCGSIFIVSAAHLFLQNFNFKSVPAPPVTECVFFQMFRDFCSGHADKIMFRNTSASRKQNGKQATKQAENHDFIHIHSSAIKTTLLPVIYHFRQEITTCRSDFYLSDEMVFPSADKKKFEFWVV